MLYPLLNATGEYVLSSPFDSLLVVGHQYTCIAVRQFDDVRKQGVDPYTAYYQPYGLSLTVFNNDSYARVAIVTLTNENGELFFVPSSYIASFPTVDGVPYVEMGLAVKIGSHYTDTDLTPLINSIKSMVTLYLGHTSATAEPLILSPVSYISNDAHNALIQNRQQSIDISSTPHAELVRLRAQYLEALDRINALENYIQTNL